LAIGRGYG
jgi:phosphatidylethanolamine/phosphatidyl-N-methylethanolamine N-methyltransferase